MLRLDDALVVGPPSRPLGRQGKRGVMAGTDPTRRSSRSTASRSREVAPDTGAEMLSLRQLEHHSTD